MKVVIAEKPSVAKDIARILGATHTNPGFLEGNGYKVTWAYGHLVALSEPAFYGWEKWDKSFLPMIPENFCLKLNEDAGAKKQFSIIKELFSTSEEIIVATDAGREGELIFRYIYEYSKCKKPFKRLWISSLTDEAILKGFKNLKNGIEYNNLYYAAKSRSEADWLVGMNATRSLTLASASPSVISLGRVQTPTLAMICARFIEHRDFKSTPYFNIKITLEKDNISFDALAVNSYQTEAEAKNVIESLFKAAECTFSEKKEKIENAPALFDLSTLQQEANKRFGFSAQKTLDLAQELYEIHKLLTYPRTGSRYLSEDMYDGLKKLIVNASELPSFKGAASMLLEEPISKRVINNKKITDHHAIIPTEKKYEGGLSKEADEIYKLVIMRFLSALSKPCKKEMTMYTFVSNGVFFKASGSIILFEGFRQIEKNLEEEKGNEENEQKLPIVSVKDLLAILKTTLDKKMTQPKKLLTEGTLLQMMETAGKDIDDKELKEVLKELGLGTPATRASIIETLFKREFITRDKKNIVPTLKGLSVYEIVKDMPLANPTLTGEWERDLNHIASGNMIYDTFLSSIKKYTASIVKDFLSMEIKGLSKEWPICPKCGKEKLKESLKAISCLHDGCKFLLWKKVNGKLIGEEDLLKLASKKETGLIKGFSSKEGKKYDGILFLKDDFSLGLRFPQGVDSKIPCPKCKGVLEVKDKTVKCKTCEFLLYKEKGSKKLSDSVLAQVLSGKTTEKVDGFLSKEGKKFGARLRLVDFKLEYVFENKT